MTEQFKPGLVYRTVGGEIAKIERVVNGLLYGDVRESRWHSAIWTLDGGYDDLGADHEKALLPGALPTPAQDDKAELVAALREVVAFAKQCADFDQDNLEAGGDELANHSLTYKQYWQDRAKITASAYARYSEIAATAIAKAERTS